MKGMKKITFFLLLLMISQRCFAQTMEQRLFGHENISQALKNYLLPTMVVDGNEKYDFSNLLKGGIVLGLGYGIYRLYQEYTRAQKEQEQLNKDVEIGKNLLERVNSTDLTANMVNIAKILHGFRISYDAEKIIFKERICPILQNHSSYLQKQEGWNEFMRLLKQSFLDLHLIVTSDYYYLQRLKEFIEQTCPDSDLLEFVKQKADSAVIARFKPVDL